MKSNQLNAIRFILLALVLLLAGLGTQAMPVDPCDISSLPREVQTKLAADYPDWQPEKLENLDHYSRAYWTKAHGKECPGIAIGHFESKTDLSYALLLVPRVSQKQLGFQIIVLSRTLPSALFVSHSVFRRNAGALSGRSDLAISKVPPGQYAGYAESDEFPKVSIHLDGLLYEAIGQASNLYYWENGQYKDLPLSD